MFILVGETKMTDAELAILSLLSEKPTYDHELHRLIEERGLRRWTAIGNSSMYYVLDKLETQGLVQRMSGETSKRMYQISAAGMGVLQTSVTDLLSTPRAYDKSFELGLANLHILKTHQVQTALTSRQQDLTAQLSRLQEMVDSGSTADSFQANALFAHRIAMIKAELAWLDDFITRWAAQAPADPELVIEPAIIPRNRQVILPQDPDSVHKQPTQEVPPYHKHTPPGMPTPPQLPKPEDANED
ncbi:hypothetical protein ARNL5_01208 [Anaerolineae bacterium]|nr:hypothetical protein ARNL5_01208 [Anaerolineae bacterium]